MLAQKKRRGPEPTGKGTQVVVRMQPDLLAGLDAAIADEDDKPGRPEMVRRILQDWLIGHGHLPIVGDQD